VKDRGGPAFESDVGRLCVRQGFSRGARPCLYARRPDVDRTTTSSEQPGTCIQCHGSVYVPYRKAGNGDLIKGFEKLNQMPFVEARKLITHPVACIDCHEPTTMQLRVTRPGFLEGIRAKKAGEGVKDDDVNRDATRQEMRSFVCGQCHVEYYFKGPEKRLVYPWVDG